MANTVNKDIVYWLEKIYEALTTPAPTPDPDDGGSDDSGDGGEGGEGGDDNNEEGE